MLKSQENFNIMNASAHEECESSKVWKQKYEENVSHIKKQLQDLRKATFDLRKKLEQNQNRIKRNLKPKRSINRKISYKASLKQNKNQLNLETEKQWEDIVEIKPTKVSNSQKSKAQIIEPSYFTKFLSQIEKTHDFLFKMIVQDRIKNGQGQTRIQRQRAKNKKAYIRTNKARRMKSRKSLRA